jgi:23S rRNA (guanine2445-N2)-methyltransferase
MPDPEHVFAACAPGLEPVLARELAALGLEARPVPGGAEASGTDAVALACVGSRVADAVSLRVYAGPDRGASRALAEARRRFGADAPLAVRREGDTATVSLDAVGSPLYKRGWRARVGAAPLRETLAAGVLLAAGYGGEAPFLDPMCGSGTLAIEAYEIAARRAPGRARAFDFERWPGHDARRTAAVRARLAAAERTPPCAILASDRNGGAVRLAQRNGASAGADALVVTRADAATLEPPGGPGLLAVNPPYGDRLADDPAPAWRALAALFARLAGWRAAVLAPDRGLERLLGGAPDVLLRARNGGIACRVLSYTL